MKENNEIETNLHTENLQTKPNVDSNTDENTSEWSYRSFGNLKNPNKIFLLLHGLSMTHDDMIELGLIFNERYKDAAFISLNGFEQFEYGAYGRQWFSLSDRSEAVIQKHANKSFIMLEKFLNYICNKFGLSLKDVILIGFSQGGMLSSYAGMMLKLGGVIGFASCLVYPKEIESTDTPMCFVHGENDEIIDVSLFKKTIMAANYYLKQNSVKTLITPNLKHAVCFDGIKFAFEFLDNNFKIDSL